MVQPAQPSRFFTPFVKSFKVSLTLIVVGSAAREVFKRFPSIAPINVLKKLTNKTLSILAKNAKFKFKLIQIEGVPQIVILKTSETQTDATTVRAFGVETDAKTVESFQAQAIAADIKAETQALADEVKEKKIETIRTGTIQFAKSFGWNVETGLAINGRTLEQKMKRSDIPNFAKIVNELKELGLVTLVENLRSLAEADNINLF